MAGGGSTVLSRGALLKLGAAVDDDLNDTIFTNYETFADDGTSMPFLPFLTPIADKRELFVDQFS